MVLPVKDAPKEGELVCQSNAITDGVYRITLDEIRLLNLAISKISKFDHPEKRIRISTKEFVDTFKIKDKNINGEKGRLSSIADGLLGKTIDTYSIDSESGKRTKRRRLWLSEVEYDIDEENTFIELVFSPDISELLFQLKGDFTLFALRAVSAFSSAYSFRVYSWLCKYRNLNLYRDGDIVTTDKVSLDAFKLMLGVENSYSEYKFLKRKIIEKAINEINSFSDLSVVLNEFKTSRRVTSISFSYIVESNPVLQSVKPKRKRLPSRPKVIAGSAAEGEWARTCISIITDFENELLKYDGECRLPISDLEKLISYYKIINVNGDEYKKRNVELASRKIKR